MKLKKLVVVLSFALAAILAAGCGNGDAASGTKAGNAKSVEDVLQDRIDEAEGKTEAETEAETEEQFTTSFYKEGEEPQTPDLTSTEGVDLDLTKLSGTLLYAQVNNMMYKPEEYKGKTVMVPGDFSAVYSEEAQRYYYGCLISDQTACCTLGVEFELPDSYVYPDDYPAEGSKITVTGVFDTYEEGPYTYCVLRNAHLVS